MGALSLSGLSLLTFWGQRHMVMTMVMIITELVNALMALAFVLAIAILLVLSKFEIIISVYFT